MPTQRYFAKHAPFPGDLAVAQLPRLSLKKILDHNAEEIDLLFEAATGSGFFLLDFTG